LKIVLVQMETVDRLCVCL